MKKPNNTSILNSTNPNRVLSFLAENPGKEFLGSEIQKVTGISRAGVYIAMLELIKQGLAGKTRKGKVYLYHVVYDNPVVRQFKVLMNTIRIKSVINKLKDTSKKIVLYGSTSRGEDYSDSDIDLFIVSNEPEITKEILFKTKIGKKIQAVVKTASEIPEFSEKNKVFSEEISRGIVLWEAKE